MDQSSSRAAGLSRPDRGGAAEEGAASATKVKSGARSWELEDMERNLRRNKDTPELGSNASGVTGGWSSPAFTRNSFDATAFDMVCTRASWSLRSEIN